ncbi:MAG: hypothetical protein K2Q10_08085, partial [Rhodospirillales bacterium]|nr:hypothetical protein [Rhodospirillales bacterium]
NTTLVHFSTASTATDLNVVNNTAVNSAASGYLVTNQTSAAANIANNFMVGTMKMLNGPGKDLGGNKVGALTNLVAPSTYNYRLKPGAPAINAGVTPPSGSVPQFEYVDTATSKARAVNGTIDSGAFEFQ